MPWIKNANGEDEFIESIFDKADLPTWDEIYNQFLINRVSSYSTENPEHNIDHKPEDSQTLTILNTIDNYWGIPHRKYLVAAVCNQINKTLFEDGKRVTCIPNMEYVMAIVSSAQTDKMIESDMDATEHTCPPIIRMQRDGKMPIRMSRDHEYVEINGLDDLELNILYRASDNENYEYITPEDENFWLVIENILSGVISYFTGEGIGWKGDNGEVLESEPMEHRGCVDSGIDPAL